MKLDTIAMDPSTAEGVVPSLNNNDQKDNKNTGAMMDLNGVVFSVSLCLIKLANLSISLFVRRLEEMLRILLVRSVFVF